MADVDGDVVPPRRRWVNQTVRALPHAEPGRLAGDEAAVGVREGDKTADVADLVQDRAFGIARPEGDVPIVAVRFGLLPVLAHCRARHPTRRLTELLACRKPGTRKADARHVKSVRVPVRYSYS